MKSHYEFRSELVTDFLLYILEENKETTDSSSNPNSPLIDLDTTPNESANESTMSNEPKPEKTVDEGILDSRAEMMGLSKFKSFFDTFYYSSLLNFQLSLFYTPQITSHNSPHFRFRFFCALIWLFRIL